MNETDLNAKMRVCKDHPRIRFRGALDSLQADILEAQILAAEKDESCLNALGEILDFVRELMSAEVNERPVKQPKLFGLTLDELREQTRKTSHSPPDYKTGALAVRLNYLRTRVRETELLALRTVKDREDILYSLNRLSSAVYWLDTRKTAKPRQNC